MVLASFNGGPSNAAALTACLLTVVVGLGTGAIVRRPGLAAIIAAPLAAVVGAITLIVGNTRGDAAGFFLQFALLFFCPIAAILAGSLAAMVGALCKRRAGEFPVQPSNDP